MFIKDDLLIAKGKLPGVNGAETLSYELHLEVMGDSGTFSDIKIVYNSLGDNTKIYELARSQGIQCVRIGNKTNPARQDIIIVTNEGGKSRFLLLQGINSFEAYFNAVPKLFIGTLDGIEFNGRIMSGASMAGRNVYLSGILDLENGSTISQSVFTEHLIDNPTFISLAQSTSEIAGTLATHGTLIQQNSEQIDIRATTQYVDETKTTLEAQLNIQSNKISIVIAEDNAVKTSFIQSVIDGVGTASILADKINFNGFTTFRRTADQITDTDITSIDGAKITSGIFQTSKGSKFGNNVSGTLDGLFINSSNYVLSNNSFKLGGDAGISFPGSGNITIGTSVVINGSVLQNCTGTLDGQSITLQNLNASNITSGTLNAGLINVININAAHINAGTLDASIVNIIKLNASNITTGTITSVDINLLNTGTNWRVLMNNLGFSQLDGNNSARFRVLAGTLTVETTGYYTIVDPADIILGSSGNETRVQSTMVTTPVIKAAAYRDGNNNVVYPAESSWGARTSIGYVATTSGGSATKEIYYRTMKINGTTIKVLCED